MKNNFLDRNIAARSIYIIIIFAVLSLIPIYLLNSVLKQGVCSAYKIETLENISDYAGDGNLIVEFENERVYCTGYSTVSNRRVLGEYYFLKINDIFLLCDMKSELPITNISYTEGVSAKGTIRGLNTLDRRLIDEMSVRFGYDKDDFKNLFAKYVFVERPEEKIKILYKYVYILTGILAVFVLIILSRLIYIIFPRQAHDYKSMKKFSNPDETCEIINFTYKGKAFGNNQLIVTESLIAVASAKRAWIYDINDLLWAYDVFSEGSNERKAWLHLFFNDKGIYSYYMKSSFVKQAMHIIQQNKTVVSGYDQVLSDLRQKSFTEFAAKCESIISPPVAVTDNSDPNPNETI